MARRCRLKPSEARHRPAPSIASIGSKPVLASEPPALPPAPLALAPPTPPALPKAPVEPEPPSFAPLLELPEVPLSEPELLAPWEPDAVGLDALAPAGLVGLEPTTLLIGVVGLGLVGVGLVGLAPGPGELPSSLQSLTLPAR